MTYEPLAELLDKVIDLEYVVRCPACHHSPLDFTVSGARCSRCQRQYVQHSGFLDFLPLEVVRTSVSQRLMESEIYSPFYEGISRPILTRLVTRRTLGQEMDLATDLLRLKRGHSMLDLGCGSGAFARRFATVLRSRGFVVGLDRSIAMLKRGEALRAADRLDNLYFIRGDTMHLPFTNDAFDRVHCAGAFHLMEDIPHAIGEIHRVLREGGLLVLSTFFSVDRLLPRAVRKIIGEQLGIHWFLPIELERLLTSTRFVIDWHSTAGAALALRAVAYK